MRRLARRAGLGVLATALVVPAGAAAASATPSTSAASPVSATSPTPVAAIAAGRGTGVVFPRSRVSVRRALARKSLIGSTFVAAANVPDRVDLRDSGFVPPVGDQGSIGACATWTIAHTIMGYYANRSGQSGAPYNALYLWQKQTGGKNPGTGTYPTSDLQEAATTGVDTEADYYQGWYGYTAQPTAAEKANAAKYKITGYTALWQGSAQPTGGKQQALEQALAAGNPVAVDFDVYDGFMHLGAQSTETAIDPETGKDWGGHMVTAVGYDSTGVILRNQWGTGWGHGGDVKVSWTFVNNQFHDAYTVNGVTSPKASGVTAADAPSVVSASATSAPATGGSSVTLTGSNLGAATAVTFGSTSATFTRSTNSGATQLVVTVPASAAAGAVPLKVTSSGGTSAPVGFTYTAPAPTVTSASTTAVSTTGGTTVTLTGSSFTGVKAVQVGTATAAGVKVLSASQISFTAPALAPGSYAVKVTTATGSSTGGPSLRYTAPAAPSVSSLSATQGPTYAATPVTVTGSGLLQVTKVTVGGAAVAFTKVSDTSLKLSVPAGGAGAASIVLYAPYTQSSAASFTRAAPAAPSLTSTTASVPAKKATVLTLSGATLSSASRATIAGKALAVSVLSASQVRVTVPALTAGSYPLVLTTAGGTVTVTVTVV